MQIMAPSPLSQRIFLIGLCAAFTIASAFAEGRAFLASVAVALGVVILLRLINRGSYGPRTRFALACLLGAIFAISAWKKHWGGAAIVAFAVCPVLLGLVGLVKLRAEHVPDE